MMGRYPTLTSDLGIVSECSRNRVPRPPQNRTTFIPYLPGASGPEELAVDLARRLQILQFLQPCEGPELVSLRRHLDSLEHLMQLPSAIARGEVAFEAGQLAMDLVEIDAIAACVAAWGSDAHFTSRELFRDDLRELADTVVVGILTHVEDLSANRLFRRVQATHDGIADVIDVHHGAPGTAVTDHAD